MSNGGGGVRVGLGDPAGGAGAGGGGGSDGAPPDPADAAPSSPSVRSLRRYWSRREAGGAAGEASPTAKKKTGPPAKTAVDGRLGELRRRFLSDRDVITPPALRTVSPVRPTARPRPRGGRGGAGGHGQRGGQKMFPATTPPPPQPRQKQQNRSPRNSSSPALSAVERTAVAEVSDVAAADDHGGGGDDHDRHDEGPPRRADSVQWRSWSDRRNWEGEAPATATARKAPAASVASASASATGKYDDGTATVAAASASTAITTQDGVVIADADDFFSGGGGGWNAAAASSAVGPATTTNEAPDEGWNEAPAAPAPAAADNRAPPAVPPVGATRGVSTTAIADGDESPRRRGGWDTRSVHGDDFLTNAPARAPEEAAAASVLGAGREDQAATVARMASLFGGAFGASGPPLPIDAGADAAGGEGGAEGGEDAASSSSSRGGGEHDGNDPYGRPHDDARGLLHSDTDADEDDTDEDADEYEYEYDGPGGDAAAHRYHYGERNIPPIGDDERGVDGGVGPRGGDGGGDRDSSSCPDDSVTHDAPTIVASGSGGNVGRPGPRVPASPSMKSRRKGDAAGRRERRRDRVRRYLLCDGGIPEADGANDGVGNDGEGGDGGGGGRSSSDESDGGSAVGPGEGIDDEGGGNGEPANPYVDLPDDGGGGGGDDDDVDVGDDDYSPEREDESPWKPPPREKDALVSTTTAAQMSFAASPKPAAAPADGAEKRPQGPTPTPRLLSSPSSDFQSRMEEKFRNRIAGGGGSFAGAGAGADAGSPNGAPAVSSAFAASSFSTPKKEKKPAGGSEAFPTAEGPGAATPTPPAANSPSPAKKAAVVEAAGVSPEEEEHVQFMLRRMGMSPPSASASGSGSVGGEERISSLTPTRATSPPGANLAERARAPDADAASIEESTTRDHGESNTAQAGAAGASLLASLAGWANTDRVRVGEGSGSVAVAVAVAVSVSVSGPPTSAGGHGGGGRSRSLDDIVDGSSELSQEQKARILRHARRQQRERSSQDEEVGGGGSGGGDDVDVDEPSSVVDRAEQVRQFQQFQQRRREQLDRLQYLAATGTGDGGGGGDEDGAAADADDGGGWQALATTPNPMQRLGSDSPSTRSIPGAPSTPSSSSSSKGPPRTPASATSSGGAGAKRSSPPAYHRGGGLYASSTGSGGGGSGSGSGGRSPRPPSSSPGVGRSGSSSSIKISDPSVAARLAAAGAIADSKFSRSLSASGSGDGGLVVANGGGVIGAVTTSSSMSSASPSRSSSTPSSRRPPLGSKKGKKNVYQHDLSNLLSSQSPSIRYMLGGSCHDGDDGHDGDDDGEGESGVFDPASLLQACSPLQPTMSEDDDDGDDDGVFGDGGHMDGATFTRGAMASWQREEEELRAMEHRQHDDDGDGDAEAMLEESAETLVAWIESILSSELQAERNIGDSFKGGGEMGGVGVGGDGSRPLRTYLTHDILNAVCRHVTLAANYLIHHPSSNEKDDEAPRTAPLLVPFRVPAEYANPVTVVRSFTSWLRQLSALTDVPPPPNHVLDNLDNRVLVSAARDEGDDRRNNSAASPSLAPEEKKEQVCSTTSSRMRMVEDVLLPGEDENVYAVPVLSFMKRVYDAASAGPPVKLDDGGAAIVEGGEAARPDDAAALDDDDDDNNFDACGGGEVATTPPRKSPARARQGPIRDHSTATGEDDAEGGPAMAAAESYVDELPPHQGRRERSGHRDAPRRRDVNRVRRRATQPPPKRAYETPPATSRQTSTSTSTSSPPSCPCPLEAAMRQCPRVLSQILSFWGDPALICAWKSVSKLCRRIIGRNEHDMMQDAVRVGGMDDHVRPSFWLWVTLERCRPSPHRPVLGYYHRHGLDGEGHFCPPHLAIYEGGDGGMASHPNDGEDGEEFGAGQDDDDAADPEENGHEGTSPPMLTRGSTAPLGASSSRPPLPSRSASDMNVLGMVDRTYRMMLQSQLLNSDEFVDFSQLERLGGEGKWHSVISRDVARAFGTLPPHKQQSGRQSRESQRDSIIRALVPASWGGGGCGEEENGNECRRTTKDDSHDMTTTDDDATYAEGSGSADGGQCRRAMHDDEQTPAAAMMTTTKGDTMVSDWGAVSGSSSSNLTGGDFNGHNNGNHGNGECHRRTAVTPAPSDEEEHEHDLALSGILTPEIKVDLQNKLGSILHALAVAHPGVGYCQGMDYVVAHIMRVLQDTLLRRSRRRMLPPVLCKYNVTTSDDDGDGRGLSSAESNDDGDKSTLLVEEGVFLVVDTLFTTYNLRHTYWPELRCLKRTCRVFERLIERKLPVLADHFQHHDLNVGLFALGWFQTLYLYLPSMPCATVCHMWDIWLVERSYKIFFRVGTAILFLSQPILLNQELEGMMTYLNTFPDATLLSPDILITCALQIKVTNRMLVEIEREVIDGLECQFS